MLIIIMSPGGALRTIFDNARGAGRVDLPQEGHEPDQRGVVQHDVVGVRGAVEEQAVQPPAAFAAAAAAAAEDGPRWVAGLPGGRARDDVPSVLALPVPAPAVELF